MARKPRLIGYMRISRNKQIVDSQQDVLERICWKIFSDKVSGKKWTRTGLSAALAAIRPGDKLTVFRVDRLGRSVVEILTIVDQLKASGASLFSVSENCDTITRNGRIQCMFLAMVAEIEHDAITVRTQAGVDSAALRGRYRGGRPKMTARQVEKAERLMRLMTADEVAARFSVARSTLFRHLKASRSTVHFSQ